MDAYTRHIQVHKVKDFKKFLKLDWISEYLNELDFCFSGDSKVSILQSTISFVYYILNCIVTHVYISIAFVKSPEVS